MTGRLVVLPSRSRVLGRSAGYGAAAGASTGALFAAALGLIGAAASQDIGALVLGLLIGAPIGAAVGAVVGVACGLTAGVSLVFFRGLAGTGRCAIGAVAGCGAGLLPATWLIAVATSSGPRHLGVPAALTVVIVVVAAALGRRAFYGKAVGARQQPYWTSRVEPKP